MQCRALHETLDNFSSIKKQYRTITLVTRFQLAPTERENRTRSTWMYQSANHNSCLPEAIIHIRGCLVIFDQVELILPFHWPTSCVSELYVFKSCEFSIAILVWFQTELLEYDAHYTQLNFLKTFSNFANQNITYACRNSMAWEDGRYSIKLKGSNEMEYHATSKTSLRPKVLSNGCMVSENHRYLFPPSSRPPLL